MTPDEPPPNNDAAAVEAARASASAQVASEAAAAAFVNADIAAAGAAEQAAEKVTSFEGRLNAWETSTATLRDDLAQERKQSEQFRSSSQAALASLNQQLSQIQTTLQEGREHRENPNPDPIPEGHPPNPSEQAPPEPPPKKKSHRWI